MTCGAKIGPLLGDSFCDHLMAPMTHTRRLFALNIFSLLLVIVAALPSCRGDVDRCQELQEIVAAKEASLARDCESNADCFVARVSSSQLVAVSDFPEDLELQATVSELEANCATPTSRSDVFAAECRQAETATESLKRCVLTYDGALVDMDATELNLDDSAQCSCSSHEQCGSTELCKGLCECLPRCEAACRQVEECDPEPFPSLGFGTDLETCVAVCEGNLRDPQLLKQVECLSTVRCDTIGSCLD